MPSALALCLVAAPSPPVCSPSEMPEARGGDAVRRRAHPQPSQPQQALPLLQDFHQHLAYQQSSQRRLLPQSQLRSRRLGPVGPGPPVTSGAQDRPRQPALVLTPSVDLTRRYYANSSSLRDRQQLRKLVDGVETQLACRRCPLSQVVYSNLVDVEWQRVSDGPSHLPMPGGLTLTSRSPTFVHRHKVRQSRCSLGQAMASGNSHEAVVQRAIAHLRDAVMMPIASERKINTFVK